MIWDVPYRELSLIRNNSRTYRMSFEDMNTPVAPIFSNSPEGGVTGISQRKLYEFPDGTDFYFRAKDDDLDIQKTGTWDDEFKEIIFEFAPSDTTDVQYDTRIDYEVDAVFPDNKRYTILMGSLAIFATRKLNV